MYKQEWVAGVTIDGVEVGGSIHNDRDVWHMDLERDGYLIVSVASWIMSYCWILVQIGT